MSETDPSDKTEEATPERRRKAREEGQFPRAKDTGAVAATLAILLVLAGLGPALSGMLSEFSERCFRDPAGLAGAGMRTVGEQAVTTLLWLCAPVAVFAATAATLAGFFEAGFQPRLELAAPKWNRLNPIDKLKSMFSPKTGMVNTALALGRVLVVAAVAYWITSAAFPDLVKLSRAPLAGGVEQLIDVTLRLCLWSTLALALLAGADYGQAWFKHEKQIRMSRQEIKDEMKQQEGNPQIRARMRARARELAKRGLAKEVKGSDVIVTNPTHIAVALRYSAREGAPVVKAKGYDEVALYIRELAKQADIPIIENKPLARALALKVKVGRAIPVELYAAVAQVLAFVYRLKNRGVRA